MVHTAWVLPVRSQQTFSSGEDATKKNKTFKFGGRLAYLWLDNSCGSTCVVSGVLEASCSAHLRVHRRQQRGPACSFAAELFLPPSHQIYISHTHTHLFFLPFPSTGLFEFQSKAATPQTPLQCTSISKHPSSSSHQRRRVHRGTPLISSSNLKKQIIAAPPSPPHPQRREPDSGDV